MSLGVAIIRSTWAKLAEEEKAEVAGSIIAEYAAEEVGGPHGDEAVDLIKRAFRDIVRERTVR